MSLQLLVSPISKLLERPEDLSSYFHQVNRLLPDDQVVLSIPHTMPAREALALMRLHGFSQLPVTSGGEVLGVFSFRAFSLEVANSPLKARVNPADLPVEEFLDHEALHYALPTEEFRSLIDVLDAKDSVVVSGPNNLVGILTPMDVLRYLYKIANAFVLIEEIELSLRSLIRVAVPDAEELKICIRTALADHYKGRELPEQLEDMSFEDYVSVVRHGDNWPLFQGTFGSSRERFITRLGPISAIRNDIFHFRRDNQSIEQHQSLATVRQWLLLRTRLATRPTEAQQ